MVVYTVEQENQGFWTPVFTVSSRRTHFQKLLEWLKYECEKGQFDVPFERVRVRHEQVAVQPTWKFDGVYGWPIKG